MENNSEYMQKTMELSLLKNQQKCLEQYYKKISEEFQSASLELKQLQTNVWKQREQFGTETLESLMKCIHAEKQLDQVKNSNETLQEISILQGQVNALKYYERKSQDEINALKKQIHELKQREQNFK